MGQNGPAVNTHTRNRDQETAPIESDLKRDMRGKEDLQQPTFALTADVSEAHRQVPVHPSNWKFFGCRVERRCDSCEYGRDFGHQLGIVLLEPSCRCCWASCAIPGWPPTGDLAHAGGSRRSGVQVRPHFLLRCRGLRQRRYGYLGGL